MPETIMGSQVGVRGDNESIQGPLSGEKPQKEWVEYWHQVVVETLKERRQQYDTRWADMKELVENSGGGLRKGNIASDFIKTLHARLLRKDIYVNVEADDPEYMQQGENAEVVANSISRVAGLQTAIRRVMTDGTWASHGVLEVGHPIDPASMSVMHVFRTPNVSDINTVADVWEEVPEIPNQYDAEVLPFPENAGTTMGETEPEPIFSPGVGYPWVSSVDPRLVVMPLRCRDGGQSPWIARLRYLTRGEMITVLGYDPGPEAVVSGEFSELFNETSEDSGWEQFPELCCIVELYIRRDRNSPTYNNWFLSFILGHPDRVLHSSVNPWGGMVPLIPIKLDALKPMYSTTLAEELQPFADAYHRGVNAVLRQLLDLLNEKHWVPTGAGLSEEAEKKLYNPYYRGPIQVNDPGGIKRVNEQTLDPDLLRTMTFVKSVAQSRSGQSDIDRGSAIKEITARQTQALLDATGISVESMGTMVAIGGRECIMKLMHLTGLYSTVGRSRKFHFGGRFASMDAGTHDWVNSMVYTVTVEDNAEEYSNEERMMWTQFIRTLFSDSQGIILPHFDGEQLAKETLKVFNKSPVLLANRSGNREPAGRNPMMEAQLQAQLSQGSQAPPGAVGGNMVDMVQGQHPERALGSRGVDLGNALRGMQSVGTGMGEY